MGEGTCGEFLACINAMNPRDQCIEATSPESYALFEAVVECVGENMCEDDACVTANCGVQLMACEGDGAE